MQRVWAIEKPVVLRDIRERELARKAKKEAKERSGSSLGIDRA